MDGRIKLIYILWCDSVGDNNGVIKSELIQMRHSPEKRMEMRKHRDAGQIWTWPWADVDIIAVP